MTLDETQIQSTESDNRSLISPKDRYAARLQMNMSAANLRARVLDAELRNLQRTFDHLGEDDSLVRAASGIVSTRRRFIIGAGKSLAHATLLAWDLAAGLGQVLLVDEVTVRSLDVLLDVRPTDVLVAFSFRRYQRRTVTVAEEFAAQGGLVIGITDAPDAPIARFAHEVVVVPTVSASYADSPTAVAAVIHLLTTLTTASAKGARRRLAERERLHQALDTYLE
ncbi:MurR/RpiR family transcriptional regulator [Micromonospora sp. NPDC048830]|uniref:MurR/RpiR family transcriptional regulator n=1 Tax=Micromonospora sp. NPDC048830 TaxID=3364257 RepID=UPI00371096E2